MKQFDFSGFSPEEQTEMFLLGGKRNAVFKKDEIIFRAGSIIREMGIVNSGRVNIESIDLWGNRSIVGSVSEGGAFAETYALCGEPLLVDAVAAENCSITFLNIAALTDTANRGRIWYAGLTEMLMRISLQKNLGLLNRIYCTSQRTVRSKIMTYLSGEAVRQGRNGISVPFDRQQMADYLNVERSALSRELGRMRKEGILEYRKNSFVLKMKN